MARIIDSRSSKFDAFAKRYASGRRLPHSQLEFHLFKKALGDCTNYRVLDIAGGMGEYARHAIEAGASHIDVVDNRREMLQLGAKVEEESNEKNDKDDNNNNNNDNHNNEKKKESENENTNTNNENNETEKPPPTKKNPVKIHWHFAYNTLPLSLSLPSTILPPSSYDLIIAMWPWDHVATFQDYIHIWKNISYYLKPGGRLVAARMTNPWCEALQSGKYGAKCALIQQTEQRGVKVTVTVKTTPPFEVESEMTEASLRGETEVPEALGIGGLRSLEVAEVEIVKRDPVFWREFVEDPYFVVFEGRKVG